ncbi:MAG: serine/threonine protein kinase [Planctomycetaceae bacterium]|nr:MAG: serine/threonine protein kinase [Planctomycetaceae bacterium]
MSTVQTLEVSGYQVVQFLGSGACSTIWRIRDCRTEKHYALKRVVKRHSGDFRFLEQALNEYDVGYRLDHPNLRHMVELRRIKSWLQLKEIHIIMELCEGQTVQENRPKSVLEALRIFMQVGAGLAYINAQGFVHADMKPNNILVGPDGNIKIIDFGQSCPLGTVKQRIQGTPDFIAPEQVQRHPLDARTDVFNFGASLFWTLAGRPIPTTLPSHKSSSLLADLAPTPLDQINPEVPAPLSKLVCDCIELHPSRRPNSMTDVIARMGLIEHKMLRDVQKAQENGKPAAPAAATAAATGPQSPHVDIDIPDILSSEDTAIGPSIQFE